MAHFNFVISQNAKWGHAGFYIDCHRMTVPENILLQKSTEWVYEQSLVHELLTDLQILLCALHKCLAAGLRRESYSAPPDTPVWDARCLFSYCSQSSLRPAFMSSIFHTHFVLYHTSCRKPPSSESHVNLILWIEADETNTNWLPRQRPLADRKNNFRSFIYSKSSTNPANFVEIVPVDVAILVRR